MASIIRCDRCGKEIPQKEWVEFPLYKIEVLGGNLEDIQHIDLCDECKADFQEWMKGGDDD